MSNIANSCSNRKEECVMHNLPDSQQISDIHQNNVNDKAEDKTIKESIIPADHEEPLQSN